MLIKNYHHLKYQHFMHISAVSALKTCITALIPYLLINLFSTRMRFTGVGLSFNFADGFIGGCTPTISLFLLILLSSAGIF